MEEICFTKMHGIGNDYIYIDCLDGEPAQLPELARMMSDRHTGVGGDGIVLICRSDKADFRMRIFNADGSEARMCGNASRCIGKYVAEHGLSQSDTVTLETLSGVKTLHLHRSPSGEVDKVTVDMGKAEFTPARIPVISSSAAFIEQPVATSAGEMHLTAVSMGNPHGVIFTDDLSTPTVHNIGAELEHHPMWPDRANIEFARVDSGCHITGRVWERGSGETMACGTGACAVAAAALRTGRCQSPLTVSLPGGDLTIEIAPDGTVLMTGGATEVFTGRYIRR